jgi:hypothetical protein
LIINLIPEPHLLRLEEQLFVSAMAIAAGFFSGQDLTVFFRRVFRYVTQKSDGFL